MSVSKILFKGFFWKSIQFFLSVATYILLANIFKAAISAEFQTFIYFFSLLTSFFSLGLDVGLNYFLSKKEISPKTARTIIVVMTFFGLIIGLPIIYYYYNPQFTVRFSSNELVLFAGLTISGGILSTLSNAIFTAYSKNHIVTKISVFFNAALALLVVFISAQFTGDKRIFCIFFTWFLMIFAQGIFIFLYSFRLTSSLSIFKFPDTIPLKKIFKFSASVFGINIIFFAAPRLLIFFLKYWVSEDLLGNYIYAYKIIEYTGAIVSFIYFPMVALTAANEDGKMEETVLFLVRASNTFVVLIGLLIVCFGQFLFLNVFGRSFSDMYSICIYLLPGLFAVCASTFFTAYFFGKGYLRFNFSSACILLIALLVLNYPFVKLYGVHGAALAFSIANVLSLLFDVYMFRRIYRYSLKDILIVNKKDVRKLISFGKVLLPSTNILGVSIFKEK